MLNETSASNSSNNHVIPLLQLYFPITRIVMTQFSEFDKFKISTLSQAAKSHIVQFGRMRATYMNIYFERFCISIRVHTDSDDVPHFFKFFMTNGGRERPGLNSPCVSSEYRRGEDPSTRGVLEYNGGTFVLWLKHIQDLFHCTRIHFVHVEERSDNYQIRCLQDFLGPQTYFRVGKFLFCQRVLKNNFPVRRLHLSSDEFRDVEFGRTVLSSEYDTLCIDLSTRMTVNDILKLKTNKLIMHMMSSSCEDLSLIIRRCIIYGWTSMRHVEIYLRTSIDANIATVLQGFKRIFTKEEKHNDVVYRSYDILKENEYRGTVYIGQDENEQVCTFFFRR
uniref:F-box domain-containing protein n=1 Tax=Caenorhabditis tropicalis TaxID=1561998 RepID=A0A1I7U131_9PELO